MYITKALPADTLEEFVTLCQLGKDILSKTGATLYELLTKKPDLEVNTIQLNGVYRVKISMGTCLSYLEKYMEEDETKDKSVLIKEAWFVAFNKFLMEVLQNVFWLQVNTDNNCTEQKSQKLIGQSDVHDNNISDCVLLHCTGNYNFWEARNSVSKDIHIDPSKSLIEKETFLSNYIKNVLYKNIDAKEPILSFDLKLTNVIKPTSVEIQIKKGDFNKKNYFCAMANFLVSKLPLWFSKYEKEENDKKQEAQGTA